MKSSWVHLACISLLLSLLSNVGHTATVELSADADSYLRDGTPRGGLEFMDVRGGSIDFRGYLRFDLSGIPANSTIDTATLELFQVGGASRNDTITGDRFALYGLNNEAGNTAQNWDEATFAVGDMGAESVAALTGVANLDHDVAGIAETISGGSSDAIINVTGTPLASFLQARYDDGGLATFILSNDDATDRGYGIGTKEHPDPTRAPVLTVEYTVIPEPATATLLATAALSLLGFRRP